MKANTTNLNWPRLTNKPWDASNIWEADAGTDSTGLKKKRENKKLPSFQVSKVKEWKQGNNLLQEMFLAETL